MAQGLVHTCPDIFLLDPGLAGRAFDPRMNERCILEAKDKGRAEQRTFYRKACARPHTHTNTNALKSVHMQTHDLGPERHGGMANPFLSLLKNRAHFPASFPFTARRLLFHL